MLTRQEAIAIYDVGRETVVHVLLEMSQKIDQFAAELTLERLLSRPFRRQQPVVGPSLAGF